MLPETSGSMTELPAVLDFGRPFWDLLDNIEWGLRLRQALLGRVVTQCALPTKSKRRLRRRLGVWAVEIGVDPGVPRAG